MGLRDFKRKLFPPSVSSSLDQSRRIIGHGGDEVSANYAVVKARTNRQVRDLETESSPSVVETGRDGGHLPNEGGLSGPALKDHLDTGPASSLTDSHGLTGSNTTTTVSTNQNLWAEAYDALEAKSDYSELLVLFKKTLADDAAVEPANTYGVADDDTGQILKIQKLAKRKLEELERSHSSFSIGGQTITVREVVAKILKVVSKFKSAINSAVSAEPHAAIAWAAIMAILPLLENILQQDKDAADGICAISFLLVRYQVMQEGVLIPELLNSSRHESSLQLLLSIREKLINVYTQVYVYQMHFVLQYGRTKVLRTLRNAAHVDNWKLMWTEIEAAGRLVDQGITEYMNLKTLETWEMLDAIKTQTSNIEISQRAILTSVNNDVQTQILLSLPHAANAIFNSGEVSRVETPCLEGTQIRILNEIQAWAEDPTSEPIYWLYGMAGTGKTSIALTVAEALARRKPFAKGGRNPRAAFLGASFFFKQGDATRNGIETLFPTIAISLTENFPDLKAQVVDAINKTPTIGKKAPQQQLDHLIVRPLLELDRNTFLPLRLIVVVDALDECINETETKELLNMLAVLEDFRKIQLHFFITSREDAHISRSFQSLSPSLYRSSNLPKIRGSIVEDGRVDDITKYLTRTLADPKTDHVRLPDWIETGDIEKLNERADGLFIYAATACRFLLQSDPFGMESCRDRLEQILTPQLSHPQQTIDDIYVKVLSFPHANSTTESRKRFYVVLQKVLGFIVVFFEPVPVASLARLLDINEKRLVTVLKRLHAILDVPKEKQLPLDFVHLSFRDFLLDNKRSKQLPFRIEEIPIHEEVFERCLQLMLENLRQNMCELVLPGHIISNADRSRIELNVSPYLRYACRYWVDHLSKLDRHPQQEARMKDNGEVHHFLKEKFLFWLETMGLIHETSKAVQIITKLQALVDPIQSPGLVAFLCDAKRFMLNIAGIIDRAPLQIYHSGLIFSPTTSIVRASFEHLIPHWITYKPAIAESWTSRILTLGGHDDFIESISFSPMGDLIATGSRDGTTRVWDYNTGTELFMFSYSSLCHTVAFSTDGKRVASGLHNGIIKVGVLAKGTAIDLKGHKKEVWRVVFSPISSSIVASISKDNTVRIWNVDRGNAMQTIDIPEGKWNCIVFSPCGNLLAAASSDASPGGRIMFWEVETGNLLGSFDGNYDGKELILALQITAKDDAVLLTSATGDYMVTENPRTGEIIRELELGDIHKVAVSRPEGNVMGVLHGATNVTICHADTWSSIKTFSADTWIGDISLSPDGKLIALVCYNGIQLWDTTIDSKMKEEEDSGKLVDGGDSLVKLLPDDNEFMSALNNGRDTGFLRLVAYGAPKRMMEKLTGGTFSPDQKLAALIVRNEGDENDLSVQIWSEQMTKETPRYDHAYDAAFSPNGGRMAVISQETVQIVSIENFEETLTIHAQHPESFEFSPNGQFAGWFSERGGRSSFHLWDVEAGKELTTREFVRYGCKMFFSPNSELVMFKADSAVLLLELPSGRERAALMEGSPGAFHPGGHLVATSERSGNIYVWETVSGCKRRNIKTHISDIKGSTRVVIWGLAFSSTGRLVAASTLSPFQEQSLRGNRWVQMWDLDSGTEIGRQTMGHSLSRHPYQMLTTQRLQKRWKQHEIVFM